LPKRVFETPWFAIDEIRTRPEWHMGEAPFYRMTGPDHVLVVPVTDDGQLVMVRQFRPARNAYTLEFPAGGVEDDETVDAAARRELVEETGYVAEDWMKLGQSGMANQRDATTCHVFSAMGINKLNAGGEAGVKTLIVSPAEIVKHIRASEMDMLVSLGAIFLAKATLGNRFPDFW
jgi:ADP-ribose pyrophosphatase YjhB (NUDIX family)